MLWEARQWLYFKSKCLYIFAMQALLEWNVNCGSGRVIGGWTLLPCRWSPGHTEPTPLAGWWLVPAGHLANTPTRGWGGRGPRCHFPCWALEGFSQFHPHFSLNRDIKRFFSLLHQYTVIFFNVNTFYCLVWLKWVIISFVCLTHSSKWTHSPVLRI